VVLILLGEDLADFTTISSSSFFADNSATTFRVSFLADCLALSFLSDLTMLSFLAAEPLPDSAVTFLADYFLSVYNLDSGVT